MRPRSPRKPALVAATISALLGLVVPAFVSAVASGSGERAAAAQSEPPPPSPPVEPPVEPPPPEPPQRECEVPRVVGLTVAAAVRVLQQSGCDLEPQIRARWTGREIVIAQDPAAGAIVPAGSLVALFFKPAVPARGGGGGGGGGSGVPGCGAPEAGVQCGAGNGRVTGGGGEKVPHNDGAGRNWPAVTGILWKVLDSRHRTKIGGAANDELLGHHGNETLNGGAGHDILWGDWDPKGNTTRQRDILIGGAGNDWIYPSHGPTKVSAGSGNDYTWAYYGKGTINCGPGRDTVRVRMTGAFKLIGCEIVKHFCAHGSNGSGGCNKKGATARAARRG